MKSLSLFFVFMRTGQNLILQVVQKFPTQEKTLLFPVGRDRKGAHNVVVGKWTPTLCS